MQWKLSCFPIAVALRAACNRINNNNTRRSPSVLSLASDSSKSSVGSGSPQPNQNCSPQQSESESLESSMMHSERSRTSNQTKSSSDQSMISIASVDFDVMDIQTRLVLPDHMPVSFPLCLDCTSAVRTAFHWLFFCHSQPLQIATATRHMIYAGDLFYFDGLLWKKVRSSNPYWLKGRLVDPLKLFFPPNCLSSCAMQMLSFQLYVVLLSDLLLLTQADYEGLLTLWEEPIILCNIEQVVPQGEQGQCQRLFSVIPRWLPHDALYNFQSVSFLS